jgi:hypothetical protein
MRVLRALAQHVWGSQEGWFPDVEEFSAGHYDDFDSINGLVGAKVLWNFQNFLVWTVTALRMLLPDANAAQELGRITTLVECLKRWRWSEIKGELTPENLVAMIRERDPDPSIGVRQMQRIMLVMQDLQVTKDLHRDGTSRLPVKVYLGLPILGLSTDDFRRPMPQPSAEPAKPRVRQPPADAIAGRWIPSTKRKPRRGGNGEVLAVEDFDEEHRGLLALKRLQASVLSAKTLERFKREIKTLAAIEHPNVLRLLAHSLEGAEIFFVAKYHAHDLGEHVASKNLTAAEILDLFAQICDGVGEAHRRSIVHRDVKPSNVLIDTRGRPVVADFGLCFTPGDERLTATNEQAGARKYMAPEQRHGHADDDELMPSTDVFALGKLLYWMLAPRAQLFDEDEYREERFEITRVTKREELAHVNKLFDVTIQRDPSARLADANVLAAATRDLIPVVAGNYRTISPDGGQRCQFCGVGRYVVRGPAVIGIEVRPSDVRVLFCEECGHALTFRVDMAKRKDAWGPQKVFHSATGVPFVGSPARSAAGA